MAYILLGLLLFIALVIVHIFFCRHTTKPGLLAKAFILLAILFFAIYAGLVLALQHSGALDPHSLWGEPFRITGGIIFLLLLPVYLCFYVLTQLTSPSKSILSTISKQGEASLAEILDSYKRRILLRHALVIYVPAGA